jgi:hypothetical protein
MIDVAQWRADKAARLARGEAKGAIPAALPIGEAIVLEQEPVEYAQKAEQDVAATQEFVRETMTPMNSDDED